ncbi:hypothetical protein BJV77DRAFT_967652 [Russula vinacea]|nr:hypothetical protein BJV77DRAFT_967652 [Russula vinacea]
MTTDTHNPSSVPVQRPQYNSMPSAQDLGGLDHESWPSGHLPDVYSAGPYPAMNAPPPARYNNSLGYDGLPHQATYIPTAAGPPQLEQYVPAIPVHNDHPPGHVSLLHNIAGPSRGNPNLIHFETSVSEELKNIASDFLHNPGSHVNKLRVRRSRSGAISKVLILLEIDDTM